MGAAIDRLVRELGYEGSLGLAVLLTAATLCLAVGVAAGAVVHTSHGLAEN